MASGCSGTHWQLCENAEPTEGERIVPLENAMDVFPGVVVENIYGFTMALHHVPLELDGWYVQAVFTLMDGSVVTSARARIILTDAP
jgi:hypothetical protein